MGGGSAAFGYSGGYYICGNDVLVCIDGGVQLDPLGYTNVDGGVFGDIVSADLCCVFELSDQYVSDIYGECDGGEYDLSVSVRGGGASIYAVYV